MHHTRGLSSCWVKVSQSASALHQISQQILLHQYANDDKIDDTSNENNNKSKVIVDNEKQCLSQVSDLTVQILSAVQEIVKCIVDEKVNGKNQIDTGSEIHALPIVDSSSPPSKLANGLIADNNNKYKNCKEVLITDNEDTNIVVGQNNEVEEISHENGDETNYEPQKKRPRISPPTSPTSPTTLGSPGTSRISGTVPTNHECKGRKRGRKPIDKQDLICYHCLTRVTPEWRRGPSGSHTLCNACGLKYAKILKRQTVPNAKPGDLQFILNSSNNKHV